MYQVSANFTRNSVIGRYNQQNIITLRIITKYEVNFKTIHKVVLGGLSIIIYDLIKIDNMGKYTLITREFMDTTFTNLYQHHINCNIQQNIMAVLYPQDNWLLMSMI